MATSKKKAAKKPSRLSRPKRKPKPLPKSFRKPIDVEYKPISEITRWPRNPKDHDESEIKLSFERFGYVAPIQRDEATGELVAGHGRVDTLSKMIAENEPAPERIFVNTDGEWWVPVLTGVVFTSISEAHAYAVADNRTSEIGGWKRELAEVLSELKAETDQGLQGLGYTDADLSALLKDMESELPEPPGDPDAVPEPPKKPVSRTGDLWRMGDHRLLCGDSTNLGDVKRLMDGDLAALMITDPPYGVSYADKNKFLNSIARGNRIQEPIKSDHGSLDEMVALWLAAFTAAFEVCRQGGAYYICSPQGGELMMMMMMCIRDAKFLLKHSIIWVKNNHVLGRSDYHYKHEPILYGWKPGAGHKFYGGNSEVSTWEINKPHKSDLHPTMKPVKLFKRAVGNSSQPGEMVYDPFLGSGTTLIACQELGRRCSGMEIDQIYCDVICRRYEDYTGKSAVLDGTGKTFAQIKLGRSRKTKRPKSKSSKR